jgi:hypothetical protein
MLASGDLVRPRFQDTDRFRKPIGIYWLQAGSVWLAGLQDEPVIWPYRLPSVAGALTAVLLTFHFGRMLFAPAAALAGAALLAASLLLIVEAHLATTDAALLACVAAAQGCLAVLYLGARRGRIMPARYAAGFWLAQGAGILIKGPITPLISGLTVAALLFADGRRRLVTRNQTGRKQTAEKPETGNGKRETGNEKRSESVSGFSVFSFWPAQNFSRKGATGYRLPIWRRQLRLGWGVPLLLLVVLPWMVAVTRETDGRFFTQWVTGDLLPKLLGGHESHGAPPGLHLFLLGATFWPGSLALGVALLHARARRGRAGERFCLAWIVPFWIFFELVPTKLPHYVLPTFPALALLAGRALLSGSLRRRTGRARHALSPVLLSPKVCPRRAEFGSPRFRNPHSAIRNWVAGEARAEPSRRVEGLPPSGDVSRFPSRLTGSPSTTLRMEFALPRHRIGGVAFRIGLLIWGTLSLGMAAGTIMLPVWLHGRSWGLSIAGGTALALGATIAVRQSLARKWPSAAGVALAAALLWSVVSLQWVLPRLDPLWLSRSVAAAVDSHQRPSAPVRVGTIGYHEPSLVFLIGTDLALIEPEVAGAFLRQHRQALVVVSDQHLSAFEKAARAAGIEIDRLWSGEGFNYSKGRWTSLHLLGRGRSPHLALTEGVQ